MSDAVRLELGDDARRVLRAFGGLAPHIQAGIVRGARRGLLLTETRVRQNAGLKFRRGAAGLSGRLTSWADSSGMELDGAIGFRRTRQFPYELSQEFGARAHGGAMAVPISGIAKAHSNRGKGPRELGVELALIKTAGKALLIEQRQQQRGWYKGVRSIVHYKLLKTLPARLRFRESVRQAMPQLEEELVTGFKEGVRGGTP